MIVYLEIIHSVYTYAQLKLFMLSTCAVHVLTFLCLSQLPLNLFSVHKIGLVGLTTAEHVVLCGSTFKHSSFLKSFSRHNVCLFTCSEKLESSLSVSRINKVGHVTSTLSEVLSDDEEYDTLVPVSPVGGLAAVSHVTAENDYILGGQPLAVY